MTTRDFLIKNLGYESFKARQCSNVFVDNNGVAYSYGWHYPLAKVFSDDLAVVNTASYSVSTSRHSVWAFSALYLRGIRAIGIPMTEGDSVVSLEQCLTSAKRELDRIKAVMATKTRQNTDVYRYLEYDRTKMIMAVTALQAALASERVLA